MGGQALIDSSTLLGRIWWQEVTGEEEALSGVDGQG